MTSDTTPRSGAASPNVIPTGRLGFRGRQATPEERALILDEFFFEEERRQPYLVQFFVLMLLSAGIAAFGLANDSAAVVIGAMLVAPLMTPILATSAAIVQGWLERTVTSIVIVIAGSLVAIGVGVVVAWLTSRLSTGAPLPGELLARTSPNLGDLCIAILAGIAGAFVSVRTEASSALPGVGIAVALVPPLATIGMALGIGSLDLAVGASLLYITNLVGIILAASIVFTLAGFGALASAASLKGRRRAGAVVLVGLVVVGLPLLWQSHRLNEDSQTQAAITRIVDEWAPDMDLQEIYIGRRDDTTHVVVRVVGTEEPPDSSSLAEMIAAKLEDEVIVGVTFTAVDEATADGQG